MWVIDTKRYKGASNVATSRAAFRKDTQALSRGATGTKLGRRSQQTSRYCQWALANRRFRYTCV